MQRRNLFKVLGAFAIGLVLPFRTAKAVPQKTYAKAARWTHLPNPVPVRPSASQLYGLATPGEPIIIVHHVATVSRPARAAKVDMTHWLQALVDTD